MKTRFLLPGVFVAGVLALHAAPLSESTFTEIVKDVSIVTQATKAAQPAKVKDVLKAPNLVRTGAGSRAELTAPDQTITRVGANTVFSFEPTSREMRLEQGSVLFHSPAGKGGGTIHSGGASAAVLGTTIIVVATPGGGFKVIVLEGTGKVTLANGKTIKLKAGQMVFILPGQSKPGPVLDINLGKLVGGSLLVNGFGDALPSLDKIKEAIQEQQKQLARGRLEDTGVPPDALLNGGAPPNGNNAINNTTYSTATVSTGRGQVGQIIGQTPFPNGKP